MRKILLKITAALFVVLFLSCEDVFHNDALDYMWRLESVEYLDSLGVWRANSDKSSKLEGAMNNHRNDEYISPDEVAPGQSTYQCDDYVQTVFDESGINNDDYFAGNSQRKTVGDHINNATEKRIPKFNKQIAPELEKGETYVVFMGDSPMNYQNHTGILRKSIHGKIYFSHNSSGNSTGGVSTREFDNEYEFQKWYDYNSFYYIKVKTK